MPKQAKLKSVLTLDNSQFVKGIKESIKFAKDLSKQFAAAPIRTTFLAGILTARAGIKGTASALQAMGKVAVETLKVASVAGATLALTMTAISVKAIGAAAQIEDLTTSFKVLLHSETAATDRMKELVNFAAHTPYMLPQVAAASRTLEVLTHGMLSTGKGLEMVGDIASATNRDFEETAVTVGRLFAALRSGTHPGEALASLQDAGAISPEARRKITGMAGVNPAAAWQMAQQELNRFSGMMEQKSHTWNGLMSTFHDSILNALAVFGKPLIDTLKPSLDQLTQVVFAVAPQIASMGTKFAAGINLGISALEEGFLHPSQLIDPLSAGLKAGFLEAANVLIAGVKTAASLIPAMADGFAGAFAGVTEIISGELMKAFAGPIAWLAAAIEEKMDVLNDFLHPDPNKLADESYRQAAIRDKAAAMQRGDTKEADRQQGLIDEYTKKTTGPTLDERRQKYLNKSDVAEAGQAQVDEGAQVLAKQAKESMEAVTKAIGAFNVQDVTGAGEQMKQFLDALKNVAEKGKRDVSRVINAQIAQSNAGTLSSAAAASAAARARSNAAIHGSLSSGGLSGASNTGGDDWIFGPKVQWNGYHPGLTPLGEMGGGALNQRATRTVSSLLPLSERRTAARQARIAEEAQNFMTGGTWDQHKGGVEGFAGSVRRGDRAAARQYIVGKEREAQEQNKQQAFADAMEKSFDKKLAPAIKTAVSEGMGEYWKKGK
jgi:hypothetical protein